MFVQHCQNLPLDNELDPPLPFSCNSHAIKQLIPAFAETSWQLSAGICSCWQSALRCWSRVGLGPSLAGYLPASSAPFQPHAVSLM